MDLNPICGFCEASVGLPKDESKAREMEQLKSIASEHLKRTVLNVSEESLVRASVVFPDDLDGSRYKNILNAINLCDSCVSYFAKKEQDILKDQQVYIKKFSGVGNIEEVMKDPLLDLKRIALDSVKSQESVIEEKLKLMEKFFPGGDGFRTTIAAGASPTNANQASGSTTVQQELFSSASTLPESTVEVEAAGTPPSADAPPIKTVHSRMQDNDIGSSNESNNPNNDGTSTAQGDDSSLVTPIITATTTSSAIKNVAGNAVSSEIVNGNEVSTIATDLGINSMFADETQKKTGEFFVEVVGGSGEPQTDSNIKKSSFTKETGEQEEVNVSGPVDPTAVMFEDNESVPTPVSKPGTPVRRKRRTSPEQEDEGLTASHTLAENKTTTIGHPKGSPAPKKPRVPRKTMKKAELVNSMLADETQKKTGEFFMEVVGGSGEPQSDSNIKETGEHEEVNVSGPVDPTAVMSEANESVPTPVSTHGKATRQRRKVDGVVKAHRNFLKDSIGKGLTLSSGLEEESTNSKNAKSVHRKGPSVPAPRAYRKNSVPLVLSIQNAADKGSSLVTASAAPSPSKNVNGSGRGGGVKKLVEEEGCPSFPEEHQKKIEAQFKYVSSSDQKYRSDESSSTSDEKDDSDDDPTFVFTASESD